MLPLGLIAPFGSCVGMCKKGSWGGRGSTMTVGTVGCAVTYTNNYIVGSGVEDKPDAVDAVLRRFNFIFFKDSRADDFFVCKYVREEVQWQHADWGTMLGSCGFYVFCGVRGSAQKIERACVDLRNS